MIVLIEGAAGSGKTLLMSRLIRKEWKKGDHVFANFPLWFDDDRTRIKRWHNLDEVYNITKGIIVIDESQKLFDARFWNLLPKTFTDKIAMHRHHMVDIYTTTQDMGHIDVRVRSNAHELYRCKSLFRFPKSQRKKPIFQLIKTQHYVRSFEHEAQRVKWLKNGLARPHFISKYWTKTYFNTYGEVGQGKYLCRIIYEKKNPKGKGKWLVRIYSRDLIGSKRAKI